MDNRKGTDSKSTRRNQKKYQNQIKHKLLNREPHCFQGYAQWHEVFRGWEGCDFTFHDMELDMQKQGLSHEEFLTEKKLHQGRQKYARQTYVKDTIIRDEYKPRVTVPTYNPETAYEELSPENKRDVDYNAISGSWYISLRDGDITSERYRELMNNYEMEHGFPLTIW